MSQNPFKSTTKSTNKRISKQFCSEGGKGYNVRASRLFTEPTGAAYSKVANRTGFLGRFLGGSELFRPTLIKNF